MEEKDKKIPGISDTATNVTNAIGTRLSADIPKPEVPEAPTPQVNTLDERKLRNELDYKNNIPQTKIDTTVGMPDIKADTAKMDQGFNERQAELKAKTEEEQEAKHRKAEKMWSAIGDGISAIANMATVGAGADSMYNPADSLHSKVKSKWDEIKANKAAVAAANRKAQMDLLLKEYELGVKSKEAEANRNFNIWKTETEEKGKNQRAKDRQAFDAEQNKQKNEATIQAAKIRGRSGGSGGGSSSEPRFYATNPNGGQLEWKDKSQAMAYMKRWLTNNGYAVPMTVFGDKYADMSTAYEDAVADWQSKQSKPTPTKSKDNAAVTP